MDEDIPEGYVPAEIDPPEITAVRRDPDAKKFSMFMTQNVADGTATLDDGREVEMQIKRTIGGSKMIFEFTFEDGRKETFMVDHLKGILTSLLSKLVEIADDEEN